MTITKQQQIESGRIPDWMLELIFTYNINSQVWMLTPDKD